MKINIYKGSDLEGVRVAAKASAYVLQRLCEAVTPGMSTLDLDRLAAEFIKETGGKSAFLNYHGYPAQICCSVNEVVVHGIGRADKVINPGDIVSLDVGVTVGGFTGDNARSVIAGGVSTPLKDKLLDATRRSLEAGIAAAVPGNRVCDIGAAVEKVVKEAGFSVVRDMVGHGCGRKMHEDPQVPNYKLPGFSPELKPGMILAIEPMVNVGTWRITIDKEDGWTVRTADGSLSAHFEHQILITQKEPEVLTCPNHQIA
jgi:methionyl aminopeptidase